MTMPVTRRQFTLGSAAVVAAPAIAKGAVPPIQTGLDRLVAGEGRDHRGERIALLTHNGARSSNGRLRSADQIAAIPGLQVLGLLAPEHGLDGRAPAGQAIPDGRDPATGLPVYSLYGAKMRPPEALLRQIDTIMIDLQDVGLRPFTYAATMIDALHLARDFGLRVFILDRPNPLGGVAVDGPLVDPALASPVSALPAPFRHGLTMLELAGLVYDNERLEFELSALPMKGWRRGMKTRELFGRYALPFTPPSPNLRSPDAILAYAATVLIEGTNMSEGRGTSRPFETIGAPWCNGTKLANTLEAMTLPGVRFGADSFTPDSSKHAGKACSGVTLFIMDEESYDPLLTGLSLIAAVRQLHPKQFAFLGDKRPFFDLLIGKAWVREALLAGDAPAAIVKRWQGDVQRFRRAAEHFPDYN